jgi:hypothetical protein
MILLDKLAASFYISFKCLSVILSSLLSEPQKMYCVLSEEYFSLERNIGLPCKTIFSHLKFFKVENVLEARLKQAGFCLNMRQKRLFYSIKGADENLTRYNF